MKNGFLSLTGFTLLEILIVIVIIGILASLAIPNFIKTTEAAKGKEAVVNLETIRTAERMYYLDNNHHSSNNGGDFSELVPSYLPENPNSNPTRNWNYWFTSPLFYAQRRAGAYNDDEIHLNYDSDQLSEDWPWPPR